MLNGIVANCTYDPAKDVRDLMSLLFQRAIADKETTTNPTMLMTMPEQTGKEVLPWDAEEIKSLWMAWGKSNRVAGFCLLMIYSGMMTGELLRLEENMINWEKQQIIGCGLKTKKERKCQFISLKLLNLSFANCAQQNVEREAKKGLYVICLSELFTRNLTR